MVAVHAHRLAPAAPDEEYVYGSCAPGWHSVAGQEPAVDDWIGTVRERGIERVCCLLAGDGGGALNRYVEAFGRERVCHTPVPDEHLVPRAELVGEILPFLTESRAAGEPVVVHSLAGLGRTGQVLAAWLVRDRGYDTERAVETVRGMGRDPYDAVAAGNASEADLHALLRAADQL